MSGVSKKILIKCKISLNPFSQVIHVRPRLCFFDHHHDMVFSLSFYFNGFRFDFWIEPTNLTTSRSHEKLLKIIYSKNEGQRKGFKSWQQLSRFSFILSDLFLLLLFSCHCHTICMTTWCVLWHDSCISSVLFCSLDWRLFMETVYAFNHLLLATNSSSFCVHVSIFS